MAFTIVSTFLFLAIGVVMIRGNWIDRRRSDMGNTNSILESFVDHGKETPSFIDWPNFDSTSTHDLIIDVDAVREAYEDVRNDATPTVWAVFKYDGKRIVYTGDSGNNYDGFLQFCEDDKRIYAYVRVEIGDEMNSGAKFVLVTWIGNRVSPLKKAKVSNDKAFLKRVCPEFTKEILADDKAELSENKVKAIVALAVGAGYGTGQ